MKERSPLTPPKFCPICQAALGLVRPTPIYNGFEFHCDCGYYALIMSYDQIALPSTKLDS